MKKRTGVAFGLGARRAQSGLILLKYGKSVSEAYQAGLDAYEKASRSSQSEADIRNNFRVAYKKFQKCISLNRSCQEAHYMLGMVYNSVGFEEYNPGKAEAEWKRAPKIKQALVELGRLTRLRAAGAAADAAGEYYSVAEGYLRAALNLDGTDQRAYYELGLVFQNIHKPDKALECWEKANKPDKNIYAQKARREIARIAPSHPLAEHAPDGGIPTVADDYLAAIGKIEAKYGGVIQVPETTILNQIGKKIVWEADLPYKCFAMDATDAKKG